MIPDWLMVTLLWGAFLVLTYGVGYWMGARDQSRILRQRMIDQYEKRLELWAKHHNIDIPDFPEKGP